MRAIISILFVAAVQVTAFGQSASDTQDSNIGCIERLQLPAYPPVANQARYFGTVTATIVVSSPGTPPSVTTAFTGNEHIKRIFSTPVVEVIQRAQFRSSCVGRMVTITFHFEPSYDVPNLPEHTILFGAPNQFGF